MRSAEALGLAQRAHGRTVLPLVLAATLLAASGAGAEDLVARGDAAYARRSEGQRDGRALPGPIAEAVAAYDAAWSQSPEDLEAAWKLLRALFFQAEYAVASGAERQALLRQGVARGREVEARLAATIGNEILLGQGALDEVAAALRGNPNAAPVCFWSAVLVASWARDANPMEALRQGVAESLRRHAELVIALDPAYEAGGAHRLLGRIHAEVPRIPFVTPWVQRERALGELHQAFALAPQDPWNQLLLGLTLLELAPDQKPKALELLQRVASGPPRPDHAVEDLGVGRMARDALARVGAP